MNIITEETAPYFAGQKSVDEVADIIQSRVRIYINESIITPRKLGARYSPEPIFCFCRRLVAFVFTRAGFFAGAILVLSLRTVKRSHLCEE